MFDQLTNRFTGALKKIRGQHRISEQNIEETLKEVRLALLEADVHFKVAKAFLEEVRQKAMGAEVLKGLDPGQQFIQILHDELVSALGSEAVPLDCRKTPAVIYLVGLQGVGKTTTAAKLALYVRQKLKKKPGLVPADLARPAAIEQLTQLARTNALPVYATPIGITPTELMSKARDWAREQMIEVLIVDTAGRSQVDEPLMAELQSMREVLPAHEVLLVADAMLGQQSVQVAEGFHQKIPLTGLILTKVDGDARGGAALSVRKAVGVPIKFLGVGEKVSALEVFHPDRLAKRLLDMGDVLSLVEKVQESVSAEELARDREKILRNDMSLDDFLKQMQQLKKLGGLQSLMGFLPGMGALKDKLAELPSPDAEMKQMEAILQSMTPQERKDPRVLNASRRERIARGSGTRVQDVNKLLRQFDEMKKMMGMFRRGGMSALGNLKNFQGFRRR